MRKKLIYIGALALACTMLATTGCGKQSVGTVVEASINEEDVDTTLSDEAIEGSFLWDDTTEYRYVIEVNSVGSLTSGAPVYIYIEETDQFTNEEIALGAATLTKILNEALIEKLNISTDEDNIYKEIPVQFKTVTTAEMDTLYDSADNLSGALASNISSIAEVGTTTDSTSSSKDLSFGQLVKYSLQTRMAATATPYKFFTTAFKATDKAGELLDDALESKTGEETVEDAATETAEEATE